VTPVLLNHVNVATTVPVVIVPDIGTYVTVAVGAVLSIVDMAHVLFHALS